ncbi:hypothetical protein KJ830_08710 [bacterium]|nr:hypothetical protein [bacterium]
MRIQKGCKLVRISIWLMFVLSLLVIPLTSYAVQDDKSDEAFVSPVNLYPKVEELAGIGAQLEQNRDQYLKVRGWELGQSAANPAGAYIGWGVGEIKLEPDDVRYGQARIVAFYRAFADAKGDFARFRQQEITTTLAREFFYDDLPEIGREMDNRAYLQERISILAEKAFDLGEEYLNRLLRELNIDPDKYRVAEKSERENIVHDAIGQVVTNRAVSSLAGVRTLANFEDLKSVGVLLIYNEQSEQIARQIARGEVVPRSPSDVVTRTILGQLEAHFTSEEDYIAVHGVRIMEDETGEKVLVAFGQWAPEITKTTSSQIREARVQAARRQARSNAIAALTNFINSTLVLEEVSQFREIEDIIRITTGKRVEEVESYEIGERVEEIVNQYGKVELEGIITVKEWAANDSKTGHIIVGNVAMWSPATRDAALGIITTQEEIPEGEIEYDDGVRESPALDHLDPTLQP